MLPPLAWPPIKQLFLAFGSLDCLARDNLNSTVFLAPRNKCMLVVKCKLSLCFESVHMIDLCEGLIIDRLVAVASCV